MFYTARVRTYPPLLSNQSWSNHRTHSHKVYPCTDHACDDRCLACQEECKRRNRLLPAVIKRDCTDLQQPPTMPAAFNEAILITPHNQAVFHYGLKCAREFAKRHDRQLMWCPPRDTAESWFLAGYTTEEMGQKQLDWLFYNARKTEGILSLCPLCYDLPMKITRGNGKDMKEYGIHNGLACSNVPQIYVLCSTHIAEKIKK